MEPPATIPKIFGSLRKRLHQIKNSDGLEYTERTVSRIFYHVKNHIFDFKAEDCLSEINNLIANINEAIQELDLIISKYRKAVPSFSDEEPVFVKFSVSTKNRIKKDLLEELNLYKHELIRYQYSLNNSINNQLSSRIKWNLTVPQLGYLFKSLVTEKIISIEKGKKEEFYRIVSDLSSTKGATNLTNNSFKNNFLKTGDLDTLDFWQGKFAHLMQRAKKNKEII